MTRDELVDTALSHVERRRHGGEEAKCVGADVRDTVVVRADVAGLPRRGLVLQPVWLQLETETYRGPHRWDVVVLLTETGELYQRTVWTRGGDKLAAALRDAKRRLEEELLVPLVAGLSPIGWTEAELQQQVAAGVVSERVGGWVPGERIVAWGQGRWRAGIVVSVARTGTVTYTFTSPTEAAAAREARRPVSLTRGKLPRGERAYRVTR